LKVNDKVTVTLAGGQTKEFTIKSGVEWRGVHSNNGTILDDEDVTLRFWATDEGELYLKRAIVGNVNSDAWVQIKVGGSVVREIRKEGSIKTIDLDVGDLTFEESCLAGYKA
jgi:hypothetical protein